MRRKTGVFHTISTVGEKVQAYVPFPLPPDPPIEWSDALRDHFHNALVALGRLDSVTALIPDPYLFMYMYVRREAVLSSQIEGTQSSLSDLLLHEQGLVPGVPLDDVREVSRYVSALEYGLQKVREGFPLSLRLIREIHEVLLASVRGADKTPGEFRRSQNWVGGTRPGNATYVPPPPDQVIECMGALELFLHDKPSRTPTLVKAALMHVQFETIHPFLDGNGRIGRLLISLLLVLEDVLKEPLLYLSLYFKSHREEYYEHLQMVRMDGDWESWIDFFAKGVEETANQAVTTVRSLQTLINEDQGKITAQTGRAVNSVLRIHQELAKQGITSIPRIARSTGTSYPTANAAIQLLEEMGIVREITGKARDRVYAYTRYFAILDAGLGG